MLTSHHDGSMLPIPPYGLLYRTLAPDSFIYLGALNSNGLVTCVWYLVTTKTQPRGLLEKRRGLIRPPNHFTIREPITVRRLTPITACGA